MLTFLILVASWFFKTPPPPERQYTNSPQHVIMQREIWSLKSDWSIELPRFAKFPRPFSPRVHTGSDNVLERIGQKNPDYPNAC